MVWLTPLAPDHSVGLGPARSGAKGVSKTSGGNYVYYGVREFGMAAIANGIALHGGLIPYTATFLMFSEYARNALRMRYRIHITFSAGNLVTVAAMHSSGYVIADNDESGTGERVAIKTGFPYYLPEHGDFNDFHQKDGTFRASQCLRKFLANQQLTSQTDRPSHYGAANALQTATKPDIRTPVPGKNFHEYQYQNNGAR